MYTVWKGNGGNQGWGECFQGVSEFLPVLPLASKEARLHAGTISTKTVAP